MLTTKYNLCYCFENIQHQHSNKLADRDIQLATNVKEENARRSQIDKPCSGHVHQRAHPRPSTPAGRTAASPAPPDRKTCPSSVRTASDTESCFSPLRLWPFWRPPTLPVAPPAPRLCARFGTHRTRGCLLCLLLLLLLLLVYKCDSLASGAVSLAVGIGGHDSILFQGLWMKPSY